MTRSPTIARREISSFFFSPIAYVSITLFLFVVGWIFRNDFEPGQPAGMRNMFDSMVWVMVFVIPVLCMGLLSQEWSSGTIESLMTAPVKESDVVMGKFMGALGFFALMLSPTIIYVIVLRIFSKVDFGPIFSGYLGILFVAAMFVAIGLFCSALTGSQVVAAVVSVVILYVITIAPYQAEANLSQHSDFWRSVISGSVYSRYADFSKGVIELGHLVFFLAITVVFLFLTMKVLESRRWK